MDYTIKQRPKIPRNRYGYLASNSTGNNIISNEGGNTSGGGSVLASLDTHKLWGNDFNGTQDIEGDLTSTGTITAPTVDTDLLEATNIKVSSLEATNGSTITCQDNFDVFGGLNAYNLTQTEDLIPSADCKYSLGFGNQRWNEFYCKNGFLHNLTVDGTLDVFQLQIDKVRAVGGRILLTDAELTVDYVADTDSEGKTIGYTRTDDGDWTLDDGYEVEAYRLYAKAEDENAVIKNEFAVNDLIICQSFNIEENIQEGVYQNVTNKYYRSTVLGYGNVNTTMSDGWTGNLIYIDIAKTDIESGTNPVTLVEGTVNPEAKDVIVQLGNRTDTDRQNAIVLSAYNDSYLDPSIKAPSFVQYKGIDDFDLTDKRVTIISPSQNLFTGDMSIVAGGYLDQYINEQIEKAAPELHTYYAYNTTPSDDGCSFTDSDDMTYIGIITTTATTQPSTGYRWMKKGDTTTFYDFVPVVTQFDVTASSKYTVNLQGYLYMYSGSDVARQTSTPDGYAVGYRMVLRSGAVQRDVTELTPSSGLYSYSLSSTDYDETTPIRYEFGLYKKITSPELRYTEYDITLCDAKMLPSAIFTVKSDAITAAVADSKTYTDGEITTISGEITVKADEVKAQVTEGLTLTGIDITNHNIKAYADNFLIQNNDGETTFTIDSDGNIVGSGDASFKGTVFATAGQFSNDDGSFKISLNLDDKYIELDGKDRFNANTGDPLSGSEEKYVRIGHSDNFTQTVTPSGSETTYGVYAGEIELKAPYLNTNGGVTGTRKMVINPYKGLELYTSDTESTPTAYIGLSGAIMRGSVFLDDIPTITSSEEDLYNNTTWQALSTGQVYAWINTDINYTLKYLMIK